MSAPRYNRSSAAIMCSPGGTSDTLNQSLFPPSCLTPGTWRSILNYKSAVRSRSRTIANNSDRTAKTVSYARIAVFGIGMLSSVETIHRTAMCDMAILRFRETRADKWRWWSTNRPLAVSSKRILRVWRTFIKIVSSSVSYRWIDWSKSDWVNSGHH